MRVLLADSRSRVRSALRALLELEAGCEIVGESTDAGDLLARTAAACPDLVLLDWGLQGQATVELLRTLRDRFPNTAVIVLSGRPELRRVAIDAGADGFVSKIDPPDRLLAAILCWQLGGDER